MKEKIIINPQNFRYEEAITDKKSPIFKQYKKGIPKERTLIAVLIGKKGIATLTKETL